MPPNTMAQLSLLAQYDDLCRHTKVLTEGCEKEFKKFVENQKQHLTQRRNAETELIDLRRKVANFEPERQRYETQLKHMKNVVMSEVEKVKKLEQEKASMERIIEIIKDVLLSNGNTIDNQTKEKFFQLSSTYKHQGGSPSRLATIEESVGSLLSPSECDESEEDLAIGVTQRKRRSRGKKSSTEHSLKKRKSEERTPRRSIDDGFRLDENFVAKKNTVQFCSTSELTSDSSEVPTPRPVLRSESEHARERTYTGIRSNTAFDYNGSTPPSRYSLGSRISKQHIFQSKQIIKAEKCTVCGKAIKFCKRALKCENCRVTCHPECKSQCPALCIPTTCTPTKGIMGTIADYAPPSAPMIPSLIVYCAMWIEDTGLKENGLYRVPGSSREVKMLKDNFLTGKTMPSLNGVDIHAVCGTIKEFLKSLKDTLIPNAVWQTFVDSANCSDDNLLYNAIFDLPQPNRDTLAFLILHWQKVAKSPDCKMPIDNLAKVLAPTVVGYSSNESTAPNSNMYAETTQICNVMERLLMIDAEFWQTFINGELEPHTLLIKTPESTPAPITSRLGPILASGQKSRNTPIVRTPLKPRTTRTGSKVGRRQFFSSPLIK